MLGVVPYVYAHTQDYMKGYKLGKEDGKTGAGGYNSIQRSVSMSNKSCSDYMKGYNDGYSSTCGCNYILTVVPPDPLYRSGWIDGNKAGIHDFMTNLSVTMTVEDRLANFLRNARDWE
jgi:hypothetical protein